MTRFLSIPDRSRPRLQIGRACGALFAVLWIQAAACAQLTYRFGAGDQATYARSVSRLSTAAPVADVLTITCLARDSQGMRLLVGLGAAADRDTSTTGPLDGVVLTIDETGRRTLPPETPARLLALDPLLDILPVLPLAARGESDWVTPADSVGRRWRCAQVGRASAAGILTFSFTEDYPAGVAEAVGLKRRGQFTFSTQAGHVVRVDVETVDGNGATVRTDSINLGARTTMPAEWAQRRSDEAARFLRALSHADRLLHELDTAASDPNTVLQKLEQLWLAFGKELDLKSGSPFVRIADARRDDVVQSRRALLGRAALGSRWMGRRAVGWTLDAADGRSVTSEDARRGVVIECFWSSESAATVHAVDVVRDLRKEIAPPDAVGILLYNVDADVVRARRAVQAVGNDPPQFMAGPLAIGDPLPVIPAVRVLDQQGVIRGVWLGWQADYTAAVKLALELAGRGK